MKFDLIQTSGIIAVFLSSILALYFYQTRKDRSSSISLLAGILLVYALMIVCSIILSSGTNRNIFKWAHIGNQSIFLIGPMLYFYIKSSLKPDFHISKRFLFHILPFIFATLYLTIKFNFLHIPITCRNNHIMLGSIAFIHSLVYFGYSIACLKQHDLSLSKALFRGQDNKSGWLPFMVYGCFLIWLTKLLFFIAWDVSGFYKGCNEIINLHFLLSFALLNGLTYFLLHKPWLFQNNKKYKHSILTSKEKQKYMAKLISLMEDEKVYRNPLISLNLLSKQLIIPNRYLSQVLNETLNKSFYDFINEYRIRDCAEFLADEQYYHKTILEIAFEVGFNTKSTFNSSFVKYLGVTPKEYRKKHQQKQNIDNTVFA
jgi:AraC-like DNA-binding protein